MKRISICILICSCLFGGAYTAVADSSIKLSGSADIMAVATVTNPTGFISRSITDQTLLSESTALFKPAREISFRSAGESILTIENRFGELLRLSTEELDYKNNGKDVSILFLFSLIKEEILSTAGIDSSQFLIRLITTSN